MKHLVLILALCATPVSAQSEEGDVNEGLSLLEEGARLFFRGLSDEMEPMLEELAENMQPALRRLMELMDDFNAYEMPEKLPNGDILIRRKPGVPSPDAPSGEIEI
ncbi:hypothetical protein C8N32_10174 [Rhodovulum imhoffii]|uniref:AAA+ family ATPase n=1 Tax=Rhodovulum imhoffii TaxID=365340 RepID=A0A2T5BW82_9RHOB|nr:hypothetical protein [Rhodovulum imhoffii]MBK5935153.1 hypothetical protein [Rhodovulum imhoffii]PTN03880.1 hypothetical protein C8N32_10174 [Rhodovulum imhoffii]